MCVCVCVDPKKGGMSDVNFDDIGKEFALYYYKCLDTNALQDLANLYVAWCCFAAGCGVAMRSWRWWWWWWLCMKSPYVGMFVYPTRFLTLPCICLCVSLSLYLCPCLCFVCVCVCVSGFPLWLGADGGVHDDMGKGHIPGGGGDH